MPVALVEDPDFTLYVGDALELLSGVPSGFARAVVTSPPYSDARDDVGWGSDLSYLDWSAEWLHRAHRVVRPDGSLMLNLGRIHRDGRESSWWIDVLRIAKDMGWLLLDEIIWHKVNAGGGRQSPYLIDRHERVLWLARSTSPYKGFDEARQPYSPATLERYQRRWHAGGGVAKGVGSRSQDGRVPHPDGAKPGSVFVTSVGADKGVAHPTPMASELAEFLVKLACPPGGLVLDPFAGSGTTAVACRKLGRRALCFELHAGYAAEAADRLAQQPLTPA